MRRRVCVTGVGVVSALGIGFEELVLRLFKGESSVRPVTRFDASRLRSRVAGELDRPLAGALPTKSYTEKRMGRSVQLAMVAAGEAVEGSGIRTDADASGGAVRDGVYVGMSGLAGLGDAVDSIVRHEREGPARTDPFLIPSLLPNMAAGQLARRHGIDGPQYTVSAACASGSQAIGLAARAIAHGEQDWALAGGVDAPITPIAFAGLEALLVLSERERATPRPFDQHGDGMVIGEGAGFFVLEERERARERGARILGELRGYGTTTGGERITLHSADAAQRCMRSALDDARLDPAQVDCVVAQASGLKAGDERELEALQRIFAVPGANPTLTSIKGHVGHTFSASGALNLAAALAAMRAGSVPPTCHFEAPEAAFAGLDIADRPVERPVAHCLVNAFAFGGINATLVASAAA